MEFGVLGAVAALRDGQETAVGGPRQQCVLGALLVELGREVTVERLTEYLWGQDPPRTSRSIIQVQVSHLRQAFPGVIQTTSGGYRAAADPDAVDLHRFRAQAARARTLGGHPDEQFAAWEAALENWRGEPLSGVGSDQLRYEVVQPLLEEHWSALTAWAEAGLAAGRYPELISRLPRLIREDPLRERLRYLHIVALYESGQRTAALAAVRDTRTALADALGIEPGREVMDLYERMLRQDDQPRPAPAVPAQRTSPPEPAFTIRNDLPRDIPDFTGRDGALRRLAELDSHAAPAAEVCVISGPGGAGKTATAVRAAHRLAAKYPDGQLFLDLHGYTEGAQPLEPPTALSMLLRAVGTSPAQIPKSPAERAALWRAAMAGRKHLLVLDNAAGADQVGPLLPAAPGSLTLVTSRSDLADLSGTSRLPLGRLDTEESLRLFATVLGSDRVECEPGAARRVARYCGGLPLALRIVASRMLTRPTWTFAHVERRLRDEPRRLRELRTLDHNMATVFDLSVRSLGAEQAEAFTVLGAKLGSSIDLHGAAALLDSDPIAADDLLQDLVSAHLLEETGADHYRFHDLTGAYARQRAKAAIPDPVREEQRGRLADHYLRTAVAAAEWLGPRTHDHEIPPGKHAQPEWANLSEVLNWFEAHQENLAAAAEYLARAARSAKAWQLAQALWRWCAHHGETDLWIRVHERALAAARAQADDFGIAVTQVGLGIAHCYSGRFASALTCLHGAHEIFTELGDLSGQVRALGNLGVVQERMGRFRPAVAAIEQVLHHATAAADRHLELQARANLTVSHAALGEVAAAREHCAAVLADGGEEIPHAQALRALGELDIRAGELGLAEGFLRSALRIFQVWGDSLGEIEVRNCLGVLYRERGDFDMAREAHQEALDHSERSAQRGREAEIRAELGITCARAGHAAEAREALEAAVRLARERGERYIEGKALLALGEPSAQLPRDRARACLSEAAALLAEIGVPEAEHAQTALEEFG